MDIIKKLLKFNILKPKIKLITHNGSFHADDIFAAATLSLLLEKEGKNFEIIRTRDPKIIEKGDYVFDVGGIYDADKNRFDHHQKEFSEKREEGIFYSSFGLVWKKFGKDLCISELASERVDHILVISIDANDNGFELVENKYEVAPYCIENFFYSMRPSWSEINLTQDEMFFKSVEIAKEVLKREIIKAKDFVLAEEKIKKIYDHADDKRIIILEKDYSHDSILGKLPEPLFVIYPRADGVSWAARTVRDDVKSFKNRKDFPKEWGALRNEELQKITGVEDAIFCHRALFLAVAESKEGAMALAQKALS